MNSSVFFNALKRQAENGSFVFALAFIVYLASLAPDLSLWDAGEFIACGSRLDVGHPPGAPLFWLLMRLATSLAPAAYAALACNVLTALCMATAAMLLSLVTRQLLLWQPCGLSRRAVTVAQHVAGLFFAFSGSVWAVAVETEVYALAALIAFAMLWLALRWRRVGEDRLLFLLAFLCGLAAGVHWLAWLALPAVGVVIGSSRGRRGIFVGFFAAALLSISLVWFASAGAFSLPLAFELFAVNVFALKPGFAFAFAIIFGVALLFGAARAPHHVVRSVASFAFSLSLGFLLCLVPLIRASQGVAMSVSSPSDPFRLNDYLCRSQYGSRPLFSGPSYASQPSGVVSRCVTRLADDRYLSVEMPYEYLYPDSQLVFFPRMTEPDDASLYAYAAWSSSPNVPDAQPSFADNLRFFLRYQFGHMFLRYFLWNFCGRQNDHIGDGGFADGNFILGLPPLDQARLHISAYDDARHGCIQLFSLPLVACLFGIALFLARRRWRSAAVVAALALVSGPALALYLNMPPYEPRERDYVFIIFFAAMAIPLALAVAHLFNALARRRLHILAVAIAVCLPALALVSGFQACNRSADHLPAALATSLLDACPPDAMLVVGGDNDTYPLWYAQEVLGHRTDVRVVNFSLLSAPWYASQMLRASHGSRPLRAQHLADVADLRQLSLFFPESDSFPDSLSIADLADAHVAASSQSGIFLFLPTRNVQVHLPDSAVTIHIDAPDLQSSEVLLLELLDSNPDRPLCLLPDVVDSHSLGLDPLIWDLGPLQFVVPDTAAVSPFRRWQLASSSFRLPDADSFLISPDEEQQLVRLHIRPMMCCAASEALQRSDDEGARQLLRRCLSWMPTSCAPADSNLIHMALLFNQAHDPGRARQILADVADHYADAYHMALAIALSDPMSSQNFMIREMAGIHSLLDALQVTGNSDIAVGLRDLIQPPAAPAHSPLLH